MRTSNSLDMAAKTGEDTTDVLEVKAKFEISDSHREEGLAPNIERPLFQLQEAHTVRLTMALGQPRRLRNSGRYLGPDSAILVQRVHDGPVEPLLVH